MKRIAKWGGWRIAVAVAVLVAAVLVAGVGTTPITGSLAAAKKGVTDTPTLLSGPGEGAETSATTAAFTWSGPAGSTYRCSLDNAPFTACPAAGITHTGLALGQHRFRVTATVAGSKESDPATRTWRVVAVVDTTPPAAPTIERVTDTEDTTKAQFRLGAPEPDVMFRCSLDGAPFAPCDASPTYEDLADGEHCFRAKAVDRAGNEGPAATHCWVVVDHRTFHVTANVGQPLYPGGSQRLDLLIGNPLNQDIHVDSVIVSVRAGTTKAGNPNPGCHGSTNLVVTQQLSGTVTVPRNSTMTLTQLGVPTSRWPVVSMPNLPVNQDACKDTTFQLTYSGTATK